MIYAYKARLERARTIRGRGLQWLGVLSTQDRRSRRHHAPATRDQTAHLRWARYQAIHRSFAPCPARQIQGNEHAPFGLLVLVEADMELGRRHMSGIAVPEEAAPFQRSRYQLTRQEGMLLAQHQRVAIEEGM